MSVGHRIARRFGVDMRREEGLPAVFLFLAFFFIICWFYTARTVREAVFLDDLGSHWKPVVDLILALSTYPIIWLYARYSDRVSKHALIVASSIAIAAMTAGFWWAFQFDSKTVSLVFYIWLGIVIVVLVSQFWTYASRVFDSRQAKRLFGFLGAGGLLGGLVGGQVARYVALTVGTRYALLVASLFLVTVALITLLMQRIRPADEESVAPVDDKPTKMEKAKGGFEAIRRSRHLTLIMLLMILTVMVAQMVDLQFKWAVEISVPEGDRRTAFIGNFYTVMNASAFVFQLLLTARIHRILGVGFAMRTLPFTMVIGSAGLWVAFLAFPGAILAMAVVLKVGENGLRYSLDQATRELLFLPVPTQARVKAKAFIDIFVQRGAKGLAAILMLPVFFGVMRQIDTVWMTLPLVVLWLLVIGRMGRQYVESFRDGLERRSLDTTLPINLADITTLELLVESLSSPDRRQVLHALHLLSSNDRGRLISPLLLYHEDPEIRLRTLETLREIGRRDVASLVERRLADEDPEVRTEAVRTLANLRGEQIVELMLPRLGDPAPGVRAAAVACLVNLGDDEQIEQAHGVFRELLSDADPVARIEAAQALGAIREPVLEAEIVRLLYDPAPRVVRAAIAAIRRRVERDGFNPIYGPTLISLLADRRLKADAREALVALGGRVIPGLVHFMGDPDEPIWVRRALPKTIARIGTPDAANALLDALERVDDRFLRRKLIEALAGVREQEVISERREAIEGAALVEGRRYFEALQRLTAVGIEKKGALDGPQIDWSGGTVEPGLLERLLAERMDEHLENVFGLLAVVHPPEDIRAAHRSLLSGRPALRNNALEYIDNTLSVGLRRQVTPLLDNRPLEAKLHHAASLGLAHARSKEAVLGEMLAGRGEGDVDGSGLQLAVLYYIYAEQVTELYDTVLTVRDSAGDTVATETADWVARRLGLPGSDTA